MQSFSKKNLSMLVLAALGGAAQADALMPGGDARILEPGDCEASAQYLLTRSTWATPWGPTLKSRTRVTTAGVHCGLMPRWQVGVQGLQMNADENGYARGLRLQARYGLVQRKDQSLSLGLELEGLRRTHLPYGYPESQQAFRFTSLGFDLRGEQRLGDSHRFTAEFQQARVRGGGSGPWTLAAGYGYRLGADWELLAELSKTQWFETTLGLGLRWSPDRSPWSVGLMLTPENEQDGGVRNKGARLSASFRF